MSSTQLLWIAATAASGVGVLIVIVAVAVRRSSILPRIQAPRRPRRGGSVRAGQGPARTLARRRESGRRWSRRQRRVLRWGIGGLAGLATLAVVYEAATVGIAVSDLTRGVAELTDASATLGTNPVGWTSDRIGGAANLNAEAHALIDRADDRLQKDPLLRVLRYLPYAGDQVTALVDVSNTARQGSASFDDALVVARAVNGTQTSQDPPGTRLLNLITAASGPWADIDSRLTPALAALNQDSGHHLLPPFASGTKQAITVLQPIDDLARVGAVASRFGPAALGAEKSQNYLVLLTNPSELRPGGGFVGAVGNVTMAKGSVASVEVRPQESYNPLIKQHTNVPSPLGRYLKFYKNSVELGDAGWDPDFPTTAKLSEGLYTAATARQVDGTISVDPYALSAMLAVTGPVDVPGYGTFNSDNFYPKLNFIVNASTAPGSGKGALTPISQAVLSRVLNAPASSWPRLLQAFQQQAEGRHIQAYFHEPNLAQATAQAHYNGGLLASSGDYLMISDANVGATKGDYYVKKSADLKTVVLSGGVVRHELDVHYDMPLPVDDTDRKLNPGEGSYRDYVRFYLPETASLASLQMTADGQPVDASVDAISFDHGRQIVGSFFRLPRGHSAEVRLFYEVPVTLYQQYDLLVQKPAGVAGLPLSMTVSYPGGQAQRQSPLGQDAHFSVNW